jgi:hypothetical protein
MVSWALMAAFNTCDHSKTLENSRISIFTTLTSTLAI